MKESVNKKAVWGIPIGAAALAAAALLFFGGDKAPAVSPGETGAPVTEPSVSTPAPTTEPARIESIELAEGLRISDFGPYSGIFMEDGTNDPVSDVMMVLLHNESEQDLQYVTFTAEAEDAVFTFEASNLAAGSSVVLLDQARQAVAPDGLTSADAEHVVFFDAPMELCTELVEVSGMDGALNVRNISDRDIAGDVYVYYKYAAEDIFYGGITFRVVVSEGLKAGELRQVPAGHYSPGLCTIVQVVCDG